MISYDIQHTIPLQTIKQTFFYLKKKKKDENISTNYFKKMEKQGNPVQRI